MPRDAGNTVALDDELMTPEETAKVMKVTVSTLKDKRWKRTGPAYIKLSPGRGGRIRYLRSSVERFLSDRSIGAA